MIDLDAQGRLADDKLKAQGLVLTQGGEPTFVPQDTSAPEWNIQALGDEKLLYARRLARMLATTLFPGAAILQSFGKQFPGEPLPRWQLGLYRSRRGAVLWKDPERLLLDQPGTAQASAEDARRLIRSVATALKLKVKGAILPAYEDIESRIRMAGGDVADRLLPRFSRRTRSFKTSRIPKEDLPEWEPFLQPVGWVLPLDHGESGWTTEAWPLPKGTDLMLFPGDSPLGLRLPLGQLPKDSLRCAMTIECRDGELIVFLPPLPSFEAFGQLVNRIEKAAKKLNLPPLRLEGYPPPGDELLESIAFTSDPGVLEINLPPADNWTEFARVIRGLHEAAEATGLRGHKFRQNGRCVSTGGGAHIILGGPDLDNNPFIKRPELLASVIRFAQHHPCLSYLFTGLFTGPSCQAPRVDETLVDLPLELEITLRALEQMPAPGNPVAMDAMLRNLLMDWNGNTHRAEISVDKFHNPDAPNGRQGLIEFRAFEMMPTADMVLAVNLLLRALTAALAEAPFNAPLKNWKEALHDRFRLPWFLRQNLGQMLDFLNARGFDFKPDWFTPHLDFRFPIITQWEVGGQAWTLRQAIEPWPVMGDHSGTGRVVDATTDRLELSVIGPADAPAPLATVNGFKLPLVAQDDGTHVCGIRYRLFDNPWGLQPQVKAHSPLSFEIIDPATDKITHAFDYLNWKREGGTYEGLPSSQDEANQRVSQRVVPQDDKCGAKATYREMPHVEATPFTLDLRRWDPIP